MRSTRSAEPIVDIHAGLPALPPDAAALLDASPNLFGSLAWWSVVVAHAVPQGAQAVFAVARSGGIPMAVLPLLRRGGGLQSLTTPYTCEYAPALAGGLADAERAAALTALARFCRRAPVTRLDALPAEWDGLSDLDAAARRTDLRPLWFDHFGNWHEDVGGLGWAAYLARRPGGLRETIRRRLRKAESLAGARFSLLVEPGCMPEATAAYESVYARSWKEPEPYASFNTALIRALAEAGWLRLGLWSIGAHPVAVQMWAVRNQSAVVLKLAHDAAFKAHSPGTVLTAMMIRHLLHAEQVSRIDFGRGDDPYKQGWAARRRQRVGVLWVDPLRPAGIAELARHHAGRLRRRLLTGERGGLCRGGAVGTASSA